jgi:hypothetical protein
MKVLLGHLTIAKFEWHADWDPTTSDHRLAILDAIGEKLRGLVDCLPLSNFGPRQPPSPFLWHRRIERSWKKDAILFNFQNPLYQKLHNLRSDLAAAFPSAQLFERNSFHISLDSVVQFKTATPESGYLAWSKTELVTAFNYNKSTGVYWEDGDGQTYCEETKGLTFQAGGANRVPHETNVSRECMSVIVDL